MNQTSPQEILINGSQLFDRIRKEILVYSEQMCRNRGKIVEILSTRIGKIRTGLKNCLNYLFEPVVIAKVMSSEQFRRVEGFNVFDLQLLRLFYEIRFCDRNRRNT